MEKLKQFFQERDHLARTLGLELLEMGPGTARVAMQIKPEHLNGVRTVHGGAIFSLADFAFAVASNSHGTVAVAVNVNISFLKAARSGTLCAEAREVACSRRIGTYEVLVHDESGELIATFQGLAYRKSDRLEDLID